ncbi:MAG TPA: IS630 family transposase [Legionellaceae bacterium]|nr:IS630 family transposase [Legionellaceae bacterium]
MIELLDKGESAHQIEAITGISLASISRIRSIYRPDLDRPTGGRPRKLSAANVHYAIRLITSRKADNAAEVTKSLRNVTNQPLTSKTVRRELQKSGMKAVVKKKRPKLNQRHQRERHDFGIAHLDWTVEDWKRVVYTDETKINRLGSDGRKWVWKRPGEKLNDRLVESTVKFGGGNLMLWGCMLWEGPGMAAKIDGKMDADLYVSILEDELLQSLEYYDKEPADIIFQQDNDPKHKSKKAMKWLEDSGMEVMIWPAQSPDLNPIEHLWVYIKAKLAEYENPPSSIAELWERVQVEWDKIPASVCQNLIESMPRRMEALVKAKGGYTKY